MKTFKHISTYADAFKLYYPLVRNIIFRKIGNEDDTNDLAQEVFLQLFRKFDEIENHRKWLYGTLRLELFTFYRRKGKNDTDIEASLNDSGLTFVNGFRDTRIVIEETINNDINFEDEKERIIFELVAINNYSYNEAGETLGLSKKQVRYRYGKIISRIKGNLRKKGINELEDLL